MTQAKNIFGIALRLFNAISTFVGMLLVVLVLSIATSCLLGSNCSVQVNKHSFTSKQVGLTQ